MFEPVILPSDSETRDAIGSVWKRVAMYSRPAAKLPGSGIPRKVPKARRKIRADSATSVSRIWRMLVVIDRTL